MEVFSFMSSCSGVKKRQQASRPNDYICWLYDGNYHILLYLVLWAKKNMFLLPLKEITSHDFADFTYDRDRRMSLF
jgi:hypothetical protein